MLYITICNYIVQLYRDTGWLQLLDSRGIYLMSSRPHAVRILLSGASSSTSVRKVMWGADQSEENKQGPWGSEVDCCHIHNNLFTEKVKWVIG